MKRFYKQLFVCATILSLSFVQAQTVSVAAERDVVSEISEGSKITKIEFEGNHLVKDSDIVRFMNMQIGDVYSKDLVQQNLKAIYKTGYFSEKMKAIPVPNDPESLTLKIYLE